MPKKPRASRGKPRAKAIRGRVPVVATRRPPSASAPISGADAFNNFTAPEYVQSQAASLLLIGSHLRGDLPATQARTEGVRAEMQFRTTPAEATLRPIPLEDLKRLGFPEMPPSSDRFRPMEAQRRAGLRFAASVAATPKSADIGTATKSLRQVARSFYRDANPQTAAALLETSLRHPNELVRVAAAASYFDVTTDPQGPLRVLESGLGSRDTLTRDVAGYALAHVDPKNPNLGKLLQSRRTPSARKPSRTSTIIHGTWARTGTWWQPPNGDFWTYLHDHVDPNIYAATDRFEWSGGYSDAARSLAGQDLENWVHQHDLDGLDLFTHSHGGSVAMLATQGGTNVGRLVLLSCPVHWPKYTPDFTKAARVISIRVHLDLVILADRGGQQFQDNRIQEHILPVWFNHFATHDPKVWQQYRVPAML